MQNDLTQDILTYFILPVWLVAGCADWFFHRASHIESTTGAEVGPASKGLEVLRRNRPRFAPAGTFVSSD
jgi:hypothetical protein